MSIQLNDTIDSNLQRDDCSFNKLCTLQQDIRLTSSKIQIDLVYDFT